MKITLKTITKHLLILSILVVLIVFTFFLYQSDKPKGVCGLKNLTNICYINSAIQSLKTDHKFDKFIIQQKTHFNIRIKTLGKLFEKLENNSQLDPLPFYKIIFDGYDGIKLDGTTGAYGNVLFSIGILIRDNFPKKKIFIDSEQFKNNTFNPTDFEYLDPLNFFFNIGTKLDVHNTIANYLNKIPDSSNFPQLILLNFDSLTILNKNMKIPNCPSQINIRNKTYNLISTIVYTEGTDLITGLRVSHVYSYCRKKKKWFKMNDMIVDKIEKNEIENEVFNNQLTRIAIYSMT